MSYLVIDDVSTYTPPQNTSLIYSEDEVYKYKTSEGGSGTIAANVLPLLAVELTDIPCLVFTEDLTTALAKNIADTDNMTIALANRASTNYLVDIAKRKVDKTDFLSAFSRTGEAIDGLASDLASEASARSGADSSLSGRLDTVEGTLPTKVDKVTGSSLVADTEITKLATYPADYATVEASIAEKQTAAQVSAAIAAVIADYYTGTQVDTKIAAAVASVFKYMGALSDYTDLPASDAEGLAVGHVYHVGTKDSKTVNAEYAWNGSAWEELGSIIDLSAYYTSAQTDSAIAAAIAQEVIDRDAAIAVVSSVAEGLDGRLTTAEGEIDVLQAATAGYDGTSTVAAAISAAQSAAESTAAADATSKANAAEAAAKSYADGLDTAMDTRVDVLEAATAGYNDVTTVASAIAAAQAAAESTAAADATSKANAAQAAAEATAAADATSKANAAQAAAEATAAADATSKANAAEAAAKSYADGLDTAMDARVDVLEAATTGFDGTNTVAAAIAAKADPIEVVILGSGTALAPQTVNLTPGKWYVAKAPFTGTLPASAAEGTYIKVSVAVGGDLRRVVAATGETINGSQNPCALGITGEGIALNGESYYFMKVGTDWVIL